MKNLLSQAALAALLLPISAVHAAEAPATPENAPGATGRGSTLPTPDGATNNGSGAPASAPQIDAKAKALLDQMRNAYKNLNSFATDMTVEVTTSPSGEKGPQKVTKSIAFQRPDRAVIKIVEPDGSVTLAAKGKTFLVIPQAGKNYLRRSFWTANKPLETALSETKGAGPSLNTWIKGGDILTQMKPLLSSLTIGELNTVEGTAVDTVVLRLKAEGMNSTLSLSSGKNDHILRRLSIEQTETGPDGKEYKTTAVETHRNVLVNVPIPANKLAFALPAGAKAVAQPGPPLYKESLKVGTRPPGIIAKDLSGKALNLEQYKGKVVLLDFWATWCPPCVEEMPDLLRTYHKYKGQGFDILGISMDKSRTDLSNFVQQSRIPWRQVFDGKVYEGAVPRLYGIMGAPVPILLGRDGKIAALDAYGEDLEKAIQAALAKPSAASTKPATKAKPVAKTTAKR